MPRKLKQKALKFVIALGMAWLMLGVGFVSLTVTAMSTQTPVDLSPQKSSTGLTWGQQTAITTPVNGALPPLPAGGLPSVPAVTILQTDPPPLPEWITTLQGEGPTNDLTVFASNLSISKSASVTVLNGNRITYTITITNNSLSQDATQILLADTPPADTQLSSVSCSNCTPGAVTHTQTISDAFGSPLQIITYTDLITWFIPELKANTVTQIIFSIDVPCKTEGAVLKNQAFVTYQQGGGSGNGVSNQIETKVILPNNAIGLLDQAGWCAEAVRNVFDLDWGDFDNDGYLDLVLASAGGTIVFRNDQGELKPFWTHPIQAFDARWGDFDNDDDLDIVSIGDGPSGGLNSPAYIHTYDNGSFTTTPFTVTRQGFRVEPGNYDNDPDLELAISYNVGGAPCGVELYQKISGIYTVTQCLQNDYTSAGLAAGDYDNDGDLDLAINEFNSTEMKVLTNSATGLITSNLLIVNTALENAYGMAWGDYNQDGLLDLAALFRDPEQVEIFRGQKSGGTITLISDDIIDVEGGFFAALGVDWADFDGDGQVDLVISGLPPQIYRFENGTFTLYKTFSEVNDFRIWQAKGGDQDNDGDMDLVMAGTSIPSQLFPNIAPVLSPTIRPLTPSAFDPFRANSVTWGDYDGDNDADLLFGAGVGVTFPGSRLYNNTNGIFALQSTFNTSGFGPHDATFTDINGDNLLDVAIATPSESQIYLNGNLGTPNWRASSSANVLAWTDFDLSNNGSLDLFVGNNGQNGLFLNSGLQGSTSSSLPLSALSDNTRSVAWGYVDNDFYPDIAIGNDGSPSRVYRNNGDQTFSPVWTSTVQSTRSVAWGDYDGDGDMDLAVGNFNQQNLIYDNINGTLSTTGRPFASNAPTGDPTTSLAWGDWNNDGRLDLAVGNYNQKDRVYANLGSTPGSPNLVSLWESSEVQQTTDLAWGDMDNDGDLDLAVSQDGLGLNGVYENTYVLAPHTKDNSTFVEEMPLPQNPAYLAIRSPGGLTDIFSTGTTDLKNLTIDFDFRVYDPDRSRAVCNTNDGEKVQALKYEYSWDGGSTWQTADVTGVAAPFSAFAARCRGQNRTVTWRAGEDLSKNQGNETVNDTVRFRITIAHLNKTGPAKRASTRAVSPPFRIRNLTCTWPDNATIIGSSPISAVIPSVFTGTVQEADGQVTFKWDFGDKSAVIQGQVAQHAYAASGLYTITLTIEGPACPVARKAITTFVVNVDGTPGTVYLPLVLKGNASTPTVSDEPTSPAIQIRHGLGQVADLQGRVEGATIQLSWGEQPVNILGYRVYRAPTGTASFIPIADLAPEQLNFVDPTVICGHAYYVTAYNDAGESLPSTATYFSPPCP